MKRYSIILLSLFFLTNCSFNKLDVKESKKVALSIDKSSNNKEERYKKMSQDKWKDFKKPEKNKLKEKLNDIQFKVTQKDGTESPFKNEYWDNKEEGIYVDIVSGEPLFSSKDKYKSGTGWPSFSKALFSDALVEKEDRKLFRKRTEIRSKYADSHLGHVFDDGPEPTGKRFCMNSAALRFIPKDKMAEEGYEDFLDSL